MAMLMCTNAQGNGLFLVIGIVESRTETPTATKLRCECGGDTFHTRPAFGVTRLWCVRCLCWVGTVRRVIEG
ncbi:hypothetical protein [Mycobacteroides chelonae]|jgi:hypothetical protein|uniref:hypothetical protein n=1 Tax=Mycobacteroides chelonae TaxID=1774 RepID=UPI0008A93E69|nr:hypothetical protein [Mycobacteroides chelonae]MBF9326020.1 hypothetical protein [Mycobacteroides chelonae]MBF9420196.1 hypothetical protein [Mycobacteroides chelonae]MBF9438664.1 hypothetical protein [Mycobacteroides chelonae]MBV6359973.1 hypothetical protein [Mycobacteroides chelonae]MEC4834424.1 hypothetical protein [Mycobacteroides chelonae]